jgi:cytochrome c
MITMLAEVPIPRDLPLSLPAPPLLIQVVLVFSFLLHILFVNLMLGGTTFTVFFELLGLKDRKFDELAHLIAKTVTVSKSLAVVLGVAPLLGINVLYSTYFYSANSLTGRVWISLVPIIIVAFLVLYLHKYTWERLQHNKPLHIAIGLVPLLLFWCVPFVFLTNINLMLFPREWMGIENFFDAMLLSNVLPRYLHFMLASHAVAALFLVAYLGRRGFAIEQRAPGLTAPDVKRTFYKAALALTIFQFAAGPLVFFTLPDPGVNMLITVVIWAGAFFALLFVALMLLEITSPDDEIGKFYLPVIGLLTITVACMGAGRHFYREHAVEDHRTLVEAKTISFENDLHFATVREQARLSLLKRGPIGETIYTQTCTTCHAMDRVLVGPSVREIVELYEDDPDGIVAWTKNPGKRRPEMLQMPAFGNQFDDTELQAVAEYMLGLVANEAREAPAPE